MEAITNGSGKGGRAPDDQELPELSLFWRWAGKATRPYAGWALIGLGALAILVGYLGVSREALVAKQLPYLVSGGITGMVLVAVGAFFLGTEDLRRQIGRIEGLEAKVDDLHRVLLKRADLPSSGAKTRAANGHDNAEERAERVALASSSSYHRPDCQMVVGKDATAVSRRDIGRRGLEPCSLCEPEPAKA